VHPDRGSGRPGSEFDQVAHVVDQVQAVAAAVRAPPDPPGQKSAAQHTMRRGQGPELAVIRRCVRELRLSSERRGESVIVAVGGELDLVTSRRLDECLTRARRRDRWIVLDLTGQPGPDQRVYRGQH
jgi:hypothetical protein